jgi:hypothetical protein
MVRYFLPPVFRPSVKRKSFGKETLYVTNKMVTIITISISVMEHILPACLSTDRTELIIWTKPDRLRDRLLSQMLPTR